jgi:hypothetical protein
MRTFHALVAVTIFAASLSAQEPVLSTETACEVFAGSSWTSSVRGFPAGFVVSHAATMSAFASGGARTEVRARSQGDRMHLDSECGASSTGSMVFASTLNGTGAAAPQAWLWTLPSNYVGELRVTSIATATPQAQVWVAVDLGVDGTDELVLNGNHSASVTLPVSAPASTRIRIRLFCNASFRGSGFEGSSQALTIAFVAGVVPATFEPIDPTYSPICGVRLFGADFTCASHALRFTTTRAASGASAWLLLGAAPLAPVLPIPGSPACVLELLPLVTLPGTIDPLGQFAWSMNASPVPAGTTIFAQVAAFDAAGTSLLTSNGILARTF